MRVLALVTEAFGGYGGIAQYNRDFLTALSMSDSITAVTAIPRFGKPSADLPAGIAQLSPSPTRTAWSARSIYQAFKWRPNLIFCGHLNSAPLAAAIGKAIDCPIWLQVHGIEAWSERGGLMRQAIEAASLISSVSRFTRSRLLSWCDIAPESVRVLPNTLGTIDQTRKKREDLISLHNLRNRKVILTVGRMAASERYKGHDRIISCLPRLRHSVPSSIYVVVGSGDDRPRLEALACDLGVGDIVKFTGQIADTELADFYTLADVFAMPSTGEGFGIVFLEAAAHGLSIIGGNRDGSVDALADGAIGTLVDPDDADLLTEALIVELLRKERKSAGTVRRFAFENFALHIDNMARSIAR